MNMLFLMNKTKDQISWVSSHDLYWENKMYTRKRSIRLRARVFYEQIVNEAQSSWLSLVENEGE